MKLEKRDNEEIRKDIFLNQINIYKDLRECIIFMKQEEKVDNSLNSLFLENKKEFLENLISNRSRNRK